MTGAKLKTSFWFAFNFAAAAVLCWLLVAASSVAVGSLIVLSHFLLDRRGEAAVEPFLLAAFFAPFAIVILAGLIWTATAKTKTARISRLGIPAGAIISLVLPYLVQTK